MLTKPQLADLLRDVNVEAVAAAAGVSTKTIYRLRHQAANPSLDMVERIVRAVDMLKPKRKARAAA
jgi:DNA-binding phage protein